MLELIFRGFLEWLYNMILECWQYFSTVLLDIMGMDFSYLRARMPVIDLIMQTMLTLGWALLLGNLIFQAIKTMMSGLGFEGEDPKLLFARTFVFGFLLLASPQICELCLDLTSRIMELLQIPDAVDISFADEASFGGLAAAWLLVIVCGVIVMFQSLKLIFEMAERYMILAVLTIAAPLAFSMGGSRNTSDIFSGWCRMYGSMCLLMAMHVVFIKMLLSVLSYYPSGLEVLPWMVLVLSVVKVAKKIDGIITRIGLNPAITGDPLGRSLPGALSYTVVRAASAQITKTIGKAAGGRRGGRSPSAPPGGPGGPHGAGPMGGARVFSTVDPGGGGGSPETLGVVQTRQESQQSTKQQSSDMRHSISSQKTGTASDVSQGAGRFAEHAEVQATQQIGVNSAVSDRTSQPGQSSYGSFRKTAVKPGERRAASRINTVAGMTSRAAATESFNTTAHDRQRTDSTSSQNAAQKSANVLAAPFSLSGTHEHGSNQVTPQQTKRGAVVNTIQTTARDHTSVNKIHTDHQKPMVGELSHSRTSGGMRGKRDSAMESGNGEPHMVRSTRRSCASEREVEYRSRLSAVSSSGTAGTGGATSASQSSARETRHSRNAPPPPATATPPVKPARSSSVRQEPHKVAERGTAPIRGGAPPAAPGIAGTAPAGQRASQTRHTAQRQAAREKSTPVAADTHGARRAATISSVQEKKTAPRNVAPKPPKKDGGTGRG